MKVGSLDPAAMDAALQGDLGMTDGRAAPTAAVAPDPPRRSTPSTPTPAGGVASRPTGRRRAPSADPPAFLAPAVRRRSARIPHPPLRSKRGLFIVLLLVAGFGSRGDRRRRRGDQLDRDGRLLRPLPHDGPRAQGLRDVARTATSPAPSATSSPGAAGWIKAKINGTRQLILLMTGAFPKPIPAPDHADLPPTSETCVRCHDVDTLVANGGPVKLVLNARYRKDEPNTRDTIALVLRPAGFGGTTDTRGVHWHIDSEVDYIAPGPARPDDRLGRDHEQGRHHRAVHRRLPDRRLDRRPARHRPAQGDRAVRRMDCIDCHNRVGHGIPTTDQSIDAAITGGKIAQDLPYIKQQASDDPVRRRTRRSPTRTRRSPGCSDYYDARSTRSSPKLKARGDRQGDHQPQGHLPRWSPRPRCRSPRRPTRTTSATSRRRAASAATTAPTTRWSTARSRRRRSRRPARPATPSRRSARPSRASSSASDRTATDDQLWVFDHKTSVSTADPTNTTCGACHTRTYCENCHNTKAVKVPHDEMVYNHAQVVAGGRRRSRAPCATSPSTAPSATPTT